MYFITYLVACSLQRQQFYISIFFLKNLRTTTGLVFLILSLFPPNLRTIFFCPTVHPYIETLQYNTLGSILSSLLFKNDQVSKTNNYHHEHEHNRLRHRSRSPTNIPFRPIWLRIPGESEQQHNHQRRPWMLRRGYYFDYIQRWLLAILPAVKHAELHCRVWVSRKYHRAGFSLFLQLEAFSGCACCDTTCDGISESDGCSCRYDDRMGRGLLVISLFF